MSELSLRERLKKVFTTTIDWACREGITDAYLDLSIDEALSEIRTEMEKQRLDDWQLRRAEANHAIGVPTHIENKSRRGLIAQAQLDAVMKCLE